MSEPVPTFGQICVEAINLAAMRPICGKQSAQIIDSMLKEHLKTPPQRHGKASSSPFGDRKAIPPTPEQVEAYSASIGYPMDGVTFCDFYLAKGWMVGRTKMKDWQAAVRNWKVNKWGTLLAPPSETKTDYTKF